MIGTRHVTTAALALGAILLATTALQGAYAQARGEGLPPSADSRITPNLADTADSNEAEPVGRGQTGPFVTGSNPDGNRARFTGQPRPGVPYPDTAAPPSKTGKQSAPYSAQRYSGGSALPPTAANQPSPGAPYPGSGYQPPSPGKQPAPSTPGGYPGTQGSAKNAPYKQGPYGAHADYSGYHGGYQGNYGGYRGGYGGQHHADCP